MRLLRTPATSTNEPVRMRSEFSLFTIADYAAQAYAAGVLAGDHHFEAAGFDVQEVKLFDGRTY